MLSHCGDSYTNNKKLRNFFVFDFAVISNSQNLILQLNIALKLENQKMYMQHNKAKVI
jgi:hypothetical protein